MTAVGRFPYRCAFFSTKVRKKTLVRHSFPDDCQQQINVTFYIPGWLKGQLNLLSSVKRLEQKIVIGFLYLSQILTYGPRTGASAT